MSSEIQDTTKENNRDRVRRLLIHPLTEDGFRRSQKVPEDKFRDLLNGLADALAYMSDDGLRALYRMMRSKGQERDRDIWPKRAQFFAVAELIEPCPLEKIPGMISWFASEAGEQAIKADTILETFEFIEAHKRPPFAENNQAMIGSKAAKRRSDLSAAQARIDRGRALAGDKAMIAYFQGKSRRVLAFVEAAREKKKEQELA